MRKMIKSTLPLLALLAWTVAMTAEAGAADAGKGAKVFDSECAECHSAKPGKNKKGPTLFGVAGRAAGGVSDYVYSDAMKASGLNWSNDRLDAYVAAPRKLVPGCKMKYDGLAEAADRADLIEYLNTLR